MKKLLTLVAVMLFAVSAFAQGAGNSRAVAASGSFGEGQYYSPAYKYYLHVQTSSSPTAGGTYSITVFPSTVKLQDGRVVNVFATNAAITIGQGANQETVTPSSVSGCGIGQPTYGCTVTATFTNGHGKGDLIQSGTNGLQEAINDAASYGGGMVFFRNDVSLSAPTSGTTTDSTANVLPANAWITYVGGVVTTAISGGTCSSWALGDSSTAARFVAADSTLTAGEKQANTGTGFTTGIASATTGMVQGSAAKLRLTCGTGSATGGVVSAHVMGYVWAAPTQ